MFKEMLTVFNLSIQQGIRVISFNFVSVLNMKMLFVQANISLYWLPVNFFCKISLLNFIKENINSAPTKHERSSHYTVTHMRNTYSNIQGRSPYVVKVVFNTTRNCS